MFITAQPLLLSLEELWKMVRIAFLNLQMERLGLGKKGGLAGGPTETAVELT